MLVQLKASAYRAALLRKYMQQKTRVTCTHFWLNMIIFNYQLVLLPHSTTAYSHINAQQIMINLFLSFVDNVIAYHQTKVNKPNPMIFNRIQREICNFP